MSGQPFAELLQREIGLDAASIGAQTLARAVLERQVACALPDAQAYWEQLLSSASELQQLIEAVVVPETWFFRDAEAFAALMLAISEQAPRPLHEPALRLLSIPCSTGEEPYSIAMALLDAGVLPERFTVDAVDISERALAHAREGWYGKNSFRGSDLRFRDRHFEPAERGYRLSQQVRAQVRFQHGNLLAPELLPGSEIYDVIFCRNVLIYFEQAAQRRALATLGRLLKRAGLLFVGAAETALVPRAEFASTKVPLAFSFRKLPVAREADAPSAPHSSAQRAPSKHVVAVRPPKVVRAAPPPVPAVGAQPAAPSAAAPSTAAPSLALATQLADAGRLDEARAACLEQLRSAGPSAPAFHLLGLLTEALGAPHEAQDYHRKALYLEPQHEQALLHLALLLERQGDRTGAQLLRSRARRVERKGER